MLDHTAHKKCRIHSLNITRGSTGFALISLKSDGSKRREDKFNGISANGMMFWTKFLFKCIFLNENVRISIRISLKFVPKAPIDNKPALLQIMASGQPGDKPLSEPMMASLLTHICVTRPQWLKSVIPEHMLQIKLVRPSCETALRWMS